MIWWLAGYCVISIVALVLMFQSCERDYNEMCGEHNENDSE